MVGDLPTHLAYTLLRGWDFVHLTQKEEKKQKKKFGDSSCYYSWVWLVEPIDAADGGGKGQSTILKWFLKEI